MTSSSADGDGHCEHYDEASVRIGPRITDWWLVILGFERGSAISRSAKFCATGINGSGTTSFVCRADGIHGGRITSSIGRAATGVHGSGTISSIGRATGIPGSYSTSFTGCSTTCVHRSGTIGSIGRATGIYGGHDASSIGHAARIDGCRTFRSIGGTTNRSIGGSGTASSIGYAAGIDGGRTFRRKGCATTGIHRSGISPTGFARRGQDVGSRPTANPRSAASFGLLQGTCGRTSTERPLSVNAELRAITNSERMHESAVVMSSTRPSTKYTCSGSSLMFWNGNTTSDGYLLNPAE